MAEPTWIIFDDISKGTTTHYRSCFYTMSCCTSTASWNDNCRERDFISISKYCSTQIAERFEIRGIIILHGSESWKQEENELTKSSSRKSTPNSKRAGGTNTTRSNARPPTSRDSFVDGRYQHTRPTKRLKASRPANRPRSKSVSHNSSSSVKNEPIPSDLRNKKHTLSDWR